VITGKNPLRIPSNAGILGGMTNRSALLTTILGFAGAAILCAMPEIGWAGLALAAVSGIAGSLGLAEMLSRNKHPVLIDQGERTTEVPEVCSNGPCRTDFRERLIAARIVQADREL